VGVSLSVFLGVSFGFAIWSILGAALCVNMLTYMTHSREFYLKRHNDVTCLDNEFSIIILIITLPLLLHNLHPSLDIPGISRATVSSIGLTGSGDAPKKRLPEHVCLISVLFLSYFCLISVLFSDEISHRTERHVFIFGHRATRRFRRGD